MELQENEILLFQGDSITHGGRCTNSDPNHVMGHGYQFIVASKLCADNLDKNIKTFNRGISGNRIADLYGRWIEDTLNLKPTILSILIGVNDVWFEHDWNSGSNPARFEKIYRLMLDEALEQNPKLKLILMEPFVGEHFSSEERKCFFTENIKGIQNVVAKLAGEYNTVFVPLQDMFDSYSKIVPSEKLIWDGVHPTIIGHELIARRWLESVEKRKF